MILELELAAKRPDRRSVQSLTSFLRRNLATLALAVACSLFAAPLQAQSTGAVLGTVTDSTGAAIPNATVTIVSHEEGITRTVSSQSDGSFIVPAVPIGIYTITIQAPSFSTFVNNTVHVDSDHNVRVDGSLKAGDIHQQVTVSDTPPQIDTHSSTEATTIPQELVDDMPSSGRNPISFVQVLPGVSNVSTSAAFAPDRNGPTFNVSGSRSSDNLLLLDGLMHSNLFRNTGENYPPPDFIGQIEAVLGNYGAQYGHNTGAILNILTKSGTNKIHGSLWEYNQNTAFNASNYITHQVNAAHQNQFGATGGGPVLHDKLYYFLGYEGFRQSKSSTTTSPLPPTKAERGLNGAAADFSADTTTPNTFLTNPNYPKGKFYAQVAPLLSPACATALGTGQYLPNAQIPNVCLNPVIATLNAKYVPQPTNGANLYQTYGSPVLNHAAEGRLDYHFRSHTIDGRYVILNTNSIGYTTSSTAIPLYESLVQFARTQTISVNDSWVLTPRTLNVLRVGYNRFLGLQSPSDSTSLNSLGSSFPVLGLPVLPAITVTGRVILSSNSTDQQKNIDEDFDALDTVSLTRGSHSIATGAEYLRLQYLNRSYFYTMGQFTFNASEVTGYPMADYMLGLFTTATAESPQIEQSGIQHNLFLFAQDDWKITKNLTLNLGLRYELPYPWYQPQNYWATFRPGQQSTVISNAPVGLVFPGDNGVPNGEVPTRYFDFAPRVGFALDVFGNGLTSLRGGFGIFYDDISANIIQNSTQPFVYQFSPNITPASISDPYAGGPTFPTKVSYTNPVFTTPFTLTYPDADLKTPYVEAFNLNVQQQLKHNLSMEIGYVGKLGHHQLVDFNSNPALYAAGATNTTASYQARRTYSNFGNIADMATIGTSNYHSLQVQMAKRLGAWVSAQGAYTWSRSLDEFSSNTTDTTTAPNVFSTSTVPSVGSPLAFSMRSEYGLSSFHATNIGSLGYTVYGPKFANRNAFLRELLGGWNLSGIYSIRSGQPLNITYGSTDYALTNTPNQRPNLLHDWHLSNGGPRTNKLSPNPYFDPTAFSGTGTTGIAAHPAAGTFGNLRRDTVIGPPSITNNMSAAKSFILPGREGMIFQFRCDAFGVFNTPNLGTPNTTAGSSSLGIITSTSGERFLQLSGHLRF